MIITGAINANSSAATPRRSLPNAARMRLEAAIFSRILLNGGMAGAFAEENR
ncbi:hypothetical protein [uncultured Phyllobacterium sp.]|uniref:hypothetical protein n=1 Tax=uncultured Phyllobacterium sp. TaxID=253813 RepID=UPI002583DC39|nr:hypothetical protein [uncultured Phyllobacterium sp.]